ncbi:SIMPL domain-containing protein, partial [Caulobacter sp. 17J65-9]|uniref:SIMPL domain-containing protein n=1 Tax=Caulobacter sp. 17J65-9 TaxID=2709382 RepID=UPI0013CBB08D
MNRIAAFTAAACAALAVAGSAAAQDLGNITGMFAAGGDSFGQGLGNAVMGADSVFVYAQGHAGPRATPNGHVFSFSVQATADTAVEAAKLRDAKLEKARAAATRFGAGFVVTDTTYNLGAEDGDFSTRLPIQPAGAGDAGAEAGKKAGFSTRATVQVAQTDPAKAPALLDALRAAGIDTISSENEMTNLFGRRAASWLGAVLDQEQTPPAVWNAAADDAVHEARAQAER